MARNKRTYDDDDGRTIVDMSGVEAPSMFLPRSPERDQKREQPRDSEESSNSIPDAPYTGEERRMMVFGALKAALLIAGFFAVGLGLVILLMVLFW
jgi:hypothetical protein